MSRETIDRRRLRAAVASKDATRVLDVVHLAWTSADDDDTRDWTPYRDALARFFPAGECIQLPAPKIGNAAQERDAVNRVARAYRRHYRAASAETVAEGRAWYVEARIVADDLASLYGFTVDQTASVIAALSPNVSWSQNVHAAHCACEGFRSGVDPNDWRGAGYGTNRVKASAILSGDLGALRGPKVTVFARGILGDSDACTIDLWMMRAAGFDHDSPTTREHRVCTAALRRVARETGETVRDLQAIVWCHVRNAS